MLTFSCQANVTYRLCSFQFAGRRGAQCLTAPSGPSAEEDLLLTAGTEPTALTLQTREHVNLMTTSRMTALTGGGGKRDFKPEGRTKGIKLGSGRVHIWTYEDFVRGCCRNQWVYGLGRLLMPQSCLLSFARVASSVGQNAVDSFLCSSVKSYVRTWLATSPLSAGLVHFQGIFFFL